DPTLLVLNDGPHHSSPARISLVPHGLHLLFQSNYNLLNGGCTPQMFSTGYVVTSPDIDRQGLDSLLSRTTLQHMRGSAIPSFITHVVLDISGGQRDSPRLSLLPAFHLVGDTTFGEHLQTVVMERGATVDLPLSIP
ncbi:MAG: hypothetical protein OEM41_04580, partial [Ignavibacteria bacterium]|nr:hypothetical protein [Ignavibacteria bacterium]